MTKVTISKDIHGDYKATTTIKVDLGKVYQEKVSEDGKIHTIVSTMNIDSMVEFYQQLAFDKAKNGDLKGYKETLEEYFRLRFNQLVGVKQYPLELKGYDNIVGLADDVEIDWSKETEFD